jgi:hypothetical protein
MPQCSDCIYHDADAHPDEGMGVCRAIPPALSVNVANVEATREVCKHFDDGQDA